MKKAFHKIKLFFRQNTFRADWAAGDGFAQTWVVDLNSQEKDFVNAQTDRMLLLKRNRREQHTLPNWPADLPQTPYWASAYARYTGK